MKRALIVFCVFALGCTHLSSGTEAADEPSELASFDEGSDTNDLEPVEENQASEETLDVEEEADTKVAEVTAEEQALPAAEVIATEEIKTSEAEEVVVSEPEAAMAIEPVSPPPSPTLVVTGKFARIQQECEVRSNPSDEADRLRTLHAGLKVWTEPADGPWKKVFLRGQESFISTSCFLTAAKVEPPQPQVETPSLAPVVTAQVEAPKEEVPVAAAPASVVSTVAQEIPPPPPPPPTDRIDPPVLSPQPELSSSNPGFLVGLGVGIVICVALMLVRRLGSRNSRATGFGEQTSTMI